MTEYQNRITPLLPLDTSHQRLPISVITGFLGSGKTTLLNQLLRQPSMHRTAVIVNEFGAVSIDHLLVRAAKEDVVIMDNGCMCCTIKGDLVQTLKELFFKRVRLEIPEFEQIVIETTGLADPAPIIHTLLDDAVIKTYFRLDSVITTVDGVYGLGQLDDHYETVKQAAVSDRLILTKSDLTDSQRLDKLKQRLHQLNPAAPILTTIGGNIDVSKLFHAGLYDPTTKSVDVQQWLQAESYPPEKLTATTDVLRHDETIQAFCLEYDQPLSWTVLNRWFQQLTALRGKDLLRVKGIVYTVETDLPVVVQGVQHIFQPPTTLPAWPTDRRHSQIVFITRNISKTVIERMLAVLVDSRSHVEACAAALILLGCG